MGVVRRREVILPFVQNVNAGAVCVIRGKEVLRHLYGNGLACARFEHLRLAVANQLYRRLFNLVFFVVVGVRLLRIDLHCLLTSHVAGVRHVDIDRVGRLLTFAALRHFHIGHFKFGVA